MTLKEPHFSELVRVFNSNICIIEDRVVHNEVKKAQIKIDPSLFFSLTQLRSEGVSFKRNMVDD